MYCKNLTNLKLPASLETIGLRALSFCYSIKNIEIPPTVKQLGEGAFYCCLELEDIKASKLEYLNRGVLGFCPKLKSIALGDHTYTPSTLFQPHKIFFGTTDTDDDDPLDEPKHRDYAAYLEDIQYTAKLRIDLDKEASEEEEEKKEKEQATRSQKRARWC